MAREDKLPQLRPVDDLIAKPEEPVVRLGKPDAGQAQKPVRLEPISEPTKANHRLVVPSREDVELRTHQPGIEAIIAPETIQPDVVEKTWGEQSASRHPVPWGWFALIALLLAGAVVWSLTHVRQADDVAAQIRFETQTTLVDIAEEEADAALLIERIDSAIRKFFEADSVNALASLVRHPERVTPLMTRYYADQPVYSSLVGSIKTLEPLTLDNRGNFWMASVSLKNGTKRNLLIEILDSGEPRIDWETLVCYQPIPWDDYVARRPAGTTLDFRVYLAPDNFYSHEFANSEQWTCFRLTARQSDEPLFGYARAGSPEALALTEMIQRNHGRELSVILRLTLPEGLASHRGVVIEKLLSPRWIYLDSPDSGP